VRGRLASPSLEVVVVYGINDMLGSILAGGNVDDVGGTSAHFVLN
jgi:hypothetical protein